MCSEESFGYPLLDRFTLLETDQLITYSQQAYLSTRKGAEHIGCKRELLTDVPATMQTSVARIVTRFPLIRRLARTQFCLQQYTGFMQPEERVSRLFCLAEISVGRGKLHTYRINSLLKLDL